MLLIHIQPFFFFTYAWHQAFLKHKQSLLLLLNYLQPAHQPSLSTIRDTREGRRGNSATASVSFKKFGDQRFIGNLTVPLNFLDQVHHKYCKNLLKS